LSQEYSSGIGGFSWPLVGPVAEQSGPKAAWAPSSVPSVDIPSLNALALRSLASLYDKKENLFYRGLRMAHEGLRKENTSRKLTLIALLGLHRFVGSGETQPFDLGLIRDMVLADPSWVRGAGDLGLLAWYTAEFVPESLPRLFRQFDFEKSLETYPDGRDARTVGLAWFLAGISQAQLAGVRGVPDLTDAAVDAYHLLLENQGSGGVFGQAACPGLLQKVVCNRFGTFSDQIYAIYALSAFAKAFQVEEPLSPALSCANAMRALQGEMGEWWFLYDKRTGRVANRYPVFSSHQDGMAPVALLALGEATGQSFHDAIYKGLSWISGRNQLGNDLRNVDHGVIWDSIQRKGRALNYWEAARSLMNAAQKPVEDRLRIHYQVRPDHFGWLLYAFGRMGLPKTAVSVKGAG
jgi:hypothetical protein